MNVKVNSKRTRVSAPVRRTQASAQKQADAKQRVHELIERRARDAEYFRKCEAEVRLLHNWSKNRYLHRSLRHLNASDAPFELGPPTQDAKTTKCKRSASVGDLRNAMQNPSLFTLNAQQVPYDVQLELVRDHKLSDRRRQQWTKHVQALKRVVIEHEKTRRKGRPVQQAQDELVEHCRLLRQLRQQWDVRLQLTRSKLERLDLIRLSRDRLRQRAFLLAQMQSLGLALVDQLQQLGRCSARTGQQVLADTVSKASTKGKSSEGKRNVSDEKKEKQKRCRSGRETKSESQIALDQGDANEVQSDGEKTDADQKMSSQMSFESQQIQLEQILMNAQQMLKRYSRISLRRNAEYSRLFSEEADFVWEAESGEWEREQNACIGLVDRLFDAFSSVITDRIRNIVRQYQHHLNDVRGSLAELDEQVREVRKQPPPFDQLTDITLDQLLKYKDTVK